MYGRAEDVVDTFLRACFDDPDNRDDEFKYWDRDKAGSAACAPQSTPERDLWGDPPF